MTLTSVTRAGLHTEALDHVFTIGASGSDHYTFQGEGLNGTVNDPTLYLTRGKTYRFENGSGGHPIRIQSTSGASGTAYNTGVTNNAGSGTVIVEVQHDAPDVLYYQCTSHANMNGVLYITGALADGGVTTAKLADDAVTNAKLGAGAVGTTEIATNAVTSDKINTGQVTTAKLGDLAVSTAKIADDAVTNAKIGAQAIGQGELANNAVGTAQIGDGTVTAAKLGSGVTDLSNDTSPQLGGDLDTNGHHILLDDNHQLRVGDGNDFNINHDSNDTYLTNSTGNLIVQQAASNSTGDTYSKARSHYIRVNGSNNHSGIDVLATGAVNLYHNNNKTLSVEDVRVDVKRRIKINNDAPNSGAGMALGQWDGGNHRIEGDSARPMFITSYNSSGIKIGASGSVISRFDSDGLKFGNDTAAANALNDYEEGTFTPALTRGYSSISYHYQNGFYTKIGNLVNFTVYIYVYQATGDADYIQISLPFTSVNDTRRETGAYATYDNGTFSSSVDSKSTCCFLIGRNVNYIIPIHRTTGSLVYGNQTRLGTGANNQYFHLSGTMYV